jgi:hypothetical protein
MELSISPFSLSVHSHSLLLDSSVFVHWYHPDHTSIASLFKGRRGAFSLSNPSHSSDPPDQLDPPTPLDGSGRDVWLRFGSFVADLTECH